MRRIDGNLRCECGQPAVYQTPTGRICENCYRIETMMAEGRGAVSYRMHQGICGVAEHSEYDGKTDRSWRWGDVFR